MIVRWTEPAVADLANICNYTEQQFGVTQSRHAALAIYNAAQSLRMMPRQGRNGRKPGTRELIIPGLPFVLVYPTRREAIEVIRILHGSQRWP